MSLAAKAVALLSCVATASGHASMVEPPPRNAVDKDLAPWKYDAPQNWDHHVDSYICPVAAGNGTIDALSLRNGQSCFFFSHGESPRQPNSCASHKHSKTNGARFRMYHSVRQVRREDGAVWLDLRV